MVGAVILNRPCRCPKMDYLDLRLDEPGAERPPRGLAQEGLGVSYGLVFGLVGLR